MKSIRVGYIFTFIYCLLAASCQKLFSNHSSCHSTAPDYTQNISLGNWESNVNFWTGGSKEHKDSTYHLGLVQQKPDNAQWSKWLQYYHLDTINTGIAPTNIVTWVLFLQKNRADSVIGPGRLVGSSVYYVRDGRLMACIFKKEHGVFYSVINTPVRNMPTLDFYKTALTFRDSPADNIDALVVGADNFEEAEWKAIKRRSRGSLTESLKILNK